MPIKTSRLAAISQGVATQVGLQISRSSNRFLDIEADSSEWLKDQGAIEYTNCSRSDDCTTRIATRQPQQPSMNAATLRG